MDKVPIDIWQNIVSFIDAKNDLLRLRSACQLFHILFTTSAVPSVGIEVAPTPRNFFGDPRYSHYTRPFEPAPEAFVKHIASLHIDIIDLKDVSLESAVLGTIWDELSRFSGVKKLEISCLRRDRDYEYGYVDVEAVLPRVLSSVIAATGGRLKYLNLDLSQALEVTSFPATLDTLCELEAFKFSHTCDKEASGTKPSACISQLRSILTSNPSIKEFHYRRFGSHVPVSLSDIFPTHIHSLSFKSVRVFSHILPAPVDHPPLNLPALNRLQHLHIFHDIYTPTVSIDQLWVSLKASGVSLKLLNTPYISPALLGYLASYQGLRYCTLHLQRQADPRSISIESVRQALSPHGATLERLRIETHEGVVPANFEGFFFTPSTTWADPSCFPTLRSLSVPCPSDFELTEDNYNLMLEFVSQFRSAETINIRWYGSTTSHTETFMKDFRTEKGRPRCFEIYHDSFGFSRFSNLVPIDS
ncbi:hypothetical protein AX16_006499 [Volvariella volvacea WC 439]|nr:hypothetical protein AX16_006499 [Volvariella volvacea WC 439]